MFFGGKKISMGSKFGLDFFFFTLQSLEQPQARHKSHEHVLLLPTVG